jgi:oligogalacturonide transport system permease protein
MFSIKKKLEKNMGFLYILPWIIGFLVFMAYPLGASLVYSFTNMSTFSGASFVGLKNYINIFTVDPDFYHSLLVTLLYVLIAVPGKVIFALIVAVILSSELRGINFFRTTYYLPSIFGGSVAISVLWKVLFQRDGTVNNLFHMLGVSAVDWLGNPKLALITIAFIPMWQFGSSMVLFLAALKQVPRELYEASKLDGASRFRTFFNITMPMISSIILFNIIMQLVACFQEFTSIFVVTSGGPEKATYVLAYKIYLEGFSYFKMGYASALSWILFILILVLTLIVFKTSKYWVYYQDGSDSL